MAERPRSRTTIVVWWTTIVVIALIAAIILAITTPWDDPAPPAVRHPRVTQSKR